MDSNSQTPETIVAAAIVDTYGTVHTLPQPARHWHVMEEMRKLNYISSLDFEEQGFLTSAGRFVGRTEALQIALTAGQVKRGDTFQPHQLFTEDVW